MEAIVLEREAVQQDTGRQDRREFDSDPRLPGERPNQQFFMQMGAPNRLPLAPLPSPLNNGLALRTIGRRMVGAGVA